MKLEKIGINEITNFNKLVPRYIKPGYQLVHSSDFEEGLSRYKKLYSYYNENKDKDMIYSSGYEYSFISYKEISGKKINSEKTIIFEPGTEFCITKEIECPEEWRLIVVTEKWEYSPYMISIDEFYTYTIPIFYYPIRTTNKIMFSVDKYEKTFLGNFKEENLFHLFDVSNHDAIRLIPLLGYLKEFILMQDNYVYEHFLQNFINILDDTKTMMKMDYSYSEKKDIMVKTIPIMQKLQNTVNNVSKYKKPMSLDECLEIVQKLEEENDKQKKLEEEREQIEKERKQQELEQRKKDYFATISAKSELLDKFNKI